MDNESGQVTVTATSEKGDINEALLQAIGDAKEKLQTDFVRWNLHELSGENGGFRHEHHVSVTITAKGPA